ncbi:MAG: proline racemase family protein [Dokdonella sp.]
MHLIDVIDSHTGGEPTRVVVCGFPELGSGTMAERRDRFRDQYDRWRRAIACEPRGSDTMVGALLQPPQSANAVAGVIFFNNVGYLGMCGHGMIGVVRTLAHIGRISAGTHVLETPVGDVVAELHDDGRVSIANVESWRETADISIEIAGYGRIRGDVAWGGNWFFITSQSALPIALAQWRELTTYCIAIREALVTAGIAGRDGAEIDHVELNTASPIAGIDGRNFVLCPGLAYDRSPCGTGTSAKLACLAADGKLAEGQVWRQESLLGSVFEATFTRSDNGIRPRITGSACMMAESRLLVDPTDAFGWGIG